MRFFFILFLIGMQGVSAQSITGSWYGNANVVLEGRHNSYLTEFILKQKGDEVEGIFGYYFRNGYQSVFVRGKYDVKTRTVRIKQIPITYFRSKNIDGVDCYMNFDGQLMLSRVETHLNGYFTTDPRYKYTCPELRVLYDIDTTEQGQQDQMIQQAVAKKVWQPTPDDVIVVAPPSKESSLVPAAPQKPASATTTPAAPPVPVAPATPVISIPEASKWTEALLSRKQIIASTIAIQSDSIRISFYDNGDVDGDTISVFLNQKPIVVQQPISAKAFQVYIALDPTIQTHELTMFANNLGSIPPNTALMIIHDGMIRHEVYLSSSLQQNATVILKRSK
jgi:hypothetical protein